MTLTTSGVNHDFVTYTNDGGKPALVEKEGDFTLTLRKFCPGYAVPSSGGQEKRCRLVRLEPASLNDPKGNQQACLKSTGRKPHTHFEFLSLNP